MFNIYVIRHGETNAGKNVIIATEDEPLNELGIQQAKKVGNDLKKLNIDTIYCSPIERAKHTLELFDLDNICIAKYNISKFKRKELIN